MALSRIVESRAVAMALPGPAAWLRLTLRTVANTRRLSEAGGDLVHGLDLLAALDRNRQTLM